MQSIAKWQSQPDRLESASPRAADSDRAMHTEKMCVQMPDDADSQAPDVHVQRHVARPRLESCGTPAPSAALSRSVLIYFGQVYFFVMSLQATVHALATKFLNEPMHAAISVGVQHR